MKRAIFYLAFIWFLSYQAYGQGRRINLVILINDKLAVEGIQNLYMSTDSSNKERMYVNYVPGDLIISDSVFNLLNSDKSELFRLHFSQITYKNNKTESADFYVGLSRNIFDLPYLILNVYDFRDKKYKNWYQYHTKDNFLVDIIFPGSGIYIRQQ